MSMAHDRPWPRARFDAELRRFGAWYHDRHPYQAMMNAGELRADEHPVQFRNPRNARRQRVD